MKRTEIDRAKIELPDTFRHLLGNGRIYDSSCSPEARVYFIERDGGMYLKRGGVGALETEAMLDGYFASLGLGPEVLEYTQCDGYDWLLTRRVHGEDCTHGIYLDDPKRLSALLGESLRALHAIDPSGCPVRDRVSVYLRTAHENYESGSYDTSHFPDSFGYRSAEEAYAVLRDGEGALRSDTLIHGDFCLPNVMLDGWRLSGYIDLGAGGIGDRHIDLFWGCWTLGFNLHTDAYRDRFLDAYGRDGVDTEILRTVAAAEVFG